MGRRAGVVIREGALKLVRSLALGIALLAERPAEARPFRVGEVEGLLDVSASYGVVVRVDERDRDLIGVGNGGLAPSVNSDNGDLNYGPGIVANQLRGTAELTLAWRGFGAFVRGYGFYDFETELNQRDHAPLGSDQEWLVGTGAALQDAYLSGRFETGGIPWLARVGNQVVNWGESDFLRFGVDTINPVDLVALAQPTSTARDTFVRQGMLWLAANATEMLAVEAFYQYDWEPVALPPVGWFFSANDRIGGAASARPSRASASSPTWVPTRTRLSGYLPEHPRGDSIRTSCGSSPPAGTSRAARGSSASPSRPSSRC